MNYFLITLFCFILNTAVPQFTNGLSKIKLSHQDSKKKVVKYGSWL